MTVKTYQVWETIIKVIVCAIVATSVILGQWIPLLVAVIAAVAIFIVLRLNVKGIIEDERTKAVTLKANRFAYSIGTLAVTVAGLVLIFTNRDDLTGTRALIGFTMFFTSFAMSIINDLAYFVISRRLGGNK